MHTVILDENSVELSCFHFKKNLNVTNLKKSEAAFNESIKSVLNNFDYSVGVYSPNKNSNDFIISFLNESMLRYCPFNLDEIVGASLSEVFLENDNDSLIKCMNDVYKTGTPLQFLGKSYENGNILNKFIINIVKIDNYVYIISKDKKDYFFLSIDQEKFFENNVNAMSIIQNGCFVKCNKKFLKFYGHENYEEVIGKKIGYTGLVNDSIDLLNESITEVLDKKLSSYTKSIEVKKDNNPSHYYDITGSYIIYDGEPAILAVYNDITQQELNRIEKERKTEEALILQDNMDLIQSVSNTCSAYRINDEYIRSSKLYKIIERKPLEEDKTKDILWDIIVDEDIHILEENYAKLNSETDFVDFIVRIHTAKGNLKYIHCYIKNKYVTDNRKDIISFYQDVTSYQLRLKELQKSLTNSKRLEENLKKIQRISKTSLLYTDHLNHENIWFSEGYSILEIPPEEYKGNMTNYLVDDDKYIWVKNHAKCTPENPEISFLQRVISSKNELKYIQTYVAYQFDEYGNKLSCISFFQDVTEECKREQKLKTALAETLKLQKSLDKIQAESKIAMGYLEQLNSSKWTHEVYDILEIDPNVYKKDSKNLIEKFVMAEDLNIRKDCIAKLSPEQSDTTFTQRVMTGKGNLKYIKTIIHQDYDEKGNMINRVSLNQDITQEIKYQNQLKTALKDKDMLLTEVHHRVKNNLQIILSLINLDRNYESDPENILNDTEHRIYAMALLHEKMYGSESFSNVNMKDYIESLVNSLFDVYLSDIKLHSNIEPIDLNMDHSIPLGLIINELVTNSITHAFGVDLVGNLYIEFKKESDNYILIVRDDGVGLPNDFDLDNLDSLGLIVVQNLTVQLGGNLSIIDCEGTGFKIEFKG